jgi:hypothetical protein
MDEIVKPDRYDLMNRIIRRSELLFKRLKAVGLMPVANMAEDIWLDAQDACDQFRDHENDELDRGLERAKNATAAVVAASFAGMALTDPDPEKAKKHKELAEAFAQPVREAE